VLLVNPINICIRNVLQSILSKSNVHSFIYITIMILVWVTEKCQMAKKHREELIRIYKVKANVVQEEKKVTLSI